MKSFDWNLPPFFRALAILIRHHPARGPSFFFPHSSAGRICITAWRAHYRPILITLWALPIIIYINEHEARAFIVLSFTYRVSSFFFFPIFNRSKCSLNQVSLPPPQKKNITKSIDEHQVELNTTTHSWIVIHL